MKVASLRGPPLGKLMEAQSRPFSSTELMEDVGLPFSGNYNQGLHQQHDWCSN
jgi:hypothetical protein